MGAQREVTSGLVAGEDVTKLATMAKLKAGRLGRELTDACLQYWGGMGFTNETPVSRAYRDSRLTSIGGGSFDCTYANDDETFIFEVDEVTSGYRVTGVSFPGD